jgi:lipopolysaccharide export system protein LptA
MKLSIQRLRWVLVAGAVLLVAVLASYIGYGRFKAMRTYRRLLAHSGAIITHDTNGFTYSQSVQGKTIFTLHAAKATQLGNGKWQLHNADLTLYGRVDGHEDHIHSSEIEYDENEGIARAHGEVHMDLQAPQSLAGGRTAGPTTDPAQPEVKAESAEVIHVRTSGLIYLRKMGLATTDQQVEFRYGTILCTAQGAEFSTDQSVLHLLANVVMDGTVHGQPVHVTAAKADLDRTGNVASLVIPVITSQGKTAKAQLAVINMRKDGSLEAVQATGNIALASGTELVTADRLDAKLNAQSVPETARLSGNVVMADANVLRPVHGSAKQVDAVFNTDGAVVSATATGSIGSAAQVSLVDKKTVATGLQRSLEGAKIVAIFVPEASQSDRKSKKTRLSELHAIGGAKAHSDSVTKTAQRKALQVNGDDLHMLFVTDAKSQPEPQKLIGSGHTLIQQDAPLGEQETSYGDTLEASFAASDSAAGNATMTLSSAVQTGNVTIHDRAAGKVALPGQKVEPGAVSAGTAERASYDGATQRLTLSGHAHLDGDNASLLAPTVWLDQRTQDADASGGVQATMLNSQQDGSKSAPVTHVLAASAHMQHATKLMEFRGTDAEPARMWQDASQVQAAVLLFDGVKHSLSAHPAANGALVHAVFAGATKSDSGKPAKTGAASVARVASAKMDYNDVLREATFSGGVKIDGAMGEVRGQTAVVFLQPASKPGDGKQKALSASSGPFGGTSGTLDRVVVSGDVQMEQPGRHGSGDLLVYNAVKDNYVLTGTPGKPPRIVDAQQGSVTGTTLLFGDAGSTIVVSGELNKKQNGGRVRTETEVRQQ